MSVREVRRLLWAILRPPPPTLLFLWMWSRWRRRHQAVAKYYHYKRQQGERAATLAEQIEQLEVVLEDLEALPPC